MARMLIDILYWGLSMSEEWYVEWSDRMVQLGTCVLRVQHEMPIIITTNTNMSRKSAPTTSVSDIAGSPISGSDYRRRYS